MKVIVLTLCLLMSGVAGAQNPSPAADREINQLFSALERSSCEFYRNGSWYSARKASAHLHQKYGYLLRKGLISSTESFIDLAASKSSMSGKPYLVRCGHSQPVSSKSWFTLELQKLRGLPAGASNALEPTPLRGLPGALRYAGPHPAPLSGVA